MSIDIEQIKVIRQLVRYTNNEGIKYGVLTNGAVWILLETFVEGTKLNERIILKADLENEKLPVVLRKIVIISKKTNIEHIEVLVKKAQILNEIWQSLLDEPEEIIKGLKPVVKSIISQGYPNYPFEDTEIEDLLKEKVEEIVSSPSEEEDLTKTYIEPTLLPVESPRIMKLNGEVFELRNSFEILVNTANWLIKSGKLKPSDCPVIRGTKRNLINKEPKHRYGNDFLAPKRLSKELVIETQYSTAGCIFSAKWLLEKFGVPSNILMIE